MVVRVEEEMWKGERRVNEEVEEEDKQEQEERKGYHLLRLQIMKAEEKEIVAMQFRSVGLRFV